MTITINETETVAHVTAPSFTIKAARFRDILSGVLAACGTDATLPVLCAGQIRWDADGFTVAATDRYRLAVGRGKWADDESVTGEGMVLVNYRDVKTLLKSVPKRARYAADHDVHVTVMGEHSLAVEWALGRQVSGSLLLATVDGDYPKWQVNVPDLDSPVATDVISFNTAYMADVDRVPHGTNAPATWRFFGTHRPAVASFPTHNGIDWSYLLMPCRIPG